MRIFAKEWVSTLLQKLGMEEGVPIESKMITRRIETAQKAVEGQHFESRKHLLEYDDVMNKQREAVYGLRRRLLEGTDQKDLILEDYVSAILGELLEQYLPGQGACRGLEYQGAERRGVHPLRRRLHCRRRQGRCAEPAGTRRRDFRQTERALRRERETDWAGRDAPSRAHDHAERDRPAVERSPAQHGPPERRHRAARLRAARSAGRVQERIVRHVRSDDAALPGRHGSLSVPDADSGAAAGSGCGRSAAESASGQGPEPGSGVPAQHGGDGNGRRPPRMVSTSADELEEAFMRRKRRELEQARMAGAGDTQPVQQVVRGQEKVGRNDPCPCGSGKKYKKCHGA